MNVSAVPAATALLLRCGATEETKPGIEDIRRLARDVKDWQRFLELSMRHAVVPLADHALAIAAASIVPADVAAQLRAASQRGALSSLQLSGELVEIIRALTEAGIDALPFKGPTLAVLVYRNLSLRQFQDLDILVHREDVERTRSSLFALGYLPVDSHDENQRASLLLTGHHEQFARGEVTVELHWTLNNRTLTQDAFERRWWELRQPVTIGGVTMRTLGPERLLLYLCMHGGKHSWARLGWLFDLQFALRAYPAADWSIVWALARENGAERMVEIGLRLVERLLDGHDYVARAMRGRGDDARAIDVASLIAKRICSEEIFEPTLDYRVQVQSRERFRDRVRYTWHILAAPHPADIAVLGLPKALHRAYYILRPIRLVWKRLARRFHPARAS